MVEPLSSLLRPQTIADFVGQEHLTGEGKPIATMLQKGVVRSMILWGPPGCGKTTLAYIISRTVDSEFFHLSGVTSSKDDLRKIIVKARANFASQKATIVFLDEIHRWNKAQQDTLLPYVEKGVITLIGATTENPSFTINNALISRSRLFVLHAITSEAIETFLQKNVAKIAERYPNIAIAPDVFAQVGKMANGDLRGALNILEDALVFCSEDTLTVDILLQAWERPNYYDRDGEEHYNIISALHKSMRDSDPDAACYWAGRMLYAGEDPLYVVRRLIRFASEDVGLADPFALVLANQAYSAVERVGMPECDLFVLQVVAYLARAPKNNLIYMLHYAVQDDVKKFGNLAVPLHIRNAPTKLMKNLDYGKGYQYAHDYEGAKVDQEHFPQELQGKVYGDWQKLDETIAKRKQEGK